MTPEPAWLSHLVQGVLMMLLATGSDLGEPLRVGFGVLAMVNLLLALASV